MPPVFPHDWQTQPEFSLLCRRAIQWFARHEGDHEIRRLSGELAECKTRLQEIAAQAMANEQDSLRVRGDLAAQSAEISRLKLELDSRREESSRAADELAARAKEIAVLREEAAHRNRTIENLHWQTSRLDQQLKDVFQSRGWKALTALRHLKASTRDCARNTRLAMVLLYRLATLPFLGRKRYLAGPRAAALGCSRTEPAAVAEPGTFRVVPHAAADFAGAAQAGANSPLFDGAWYQAQYPDLVGQDPFVHYLTYGAWEGRKPHPLFDSRWYLERYPDVRRQGLNPLLHFLAYGTDSRCWPNPLFDTAWYLQQNPDVARSGVNPLLHFLAKGCAEGRKPNPCFDSKWYLQQHPELAATNINPLSHYVCIGEAAGFPPSPLFDPQWYAAQHADAKASGRGPLAHYLHVGMGQKAAPNAVAAWVFGGSIPSNPLVFKHEETPLVSIVVPVHNQWQFTLWCLRSIWANSGDVSYEVIVADDASTDETLDIRRIVENVTVLRNDPAAGGPLGFLTNCNRAAAKARGKYVLFLNNDTLLHSDCLKALVQVAEQDPKIGLVGCKILSADGRLQEAGGIIWRDATGWNYGRGDDPELPDYNYLRETDYCSGAAILVRRELWENIGGFDERFVPAYYEDTDLAFEIRQRGYRVMYQPGAVVVHFEGASHGIDVTQGVKRHQIVNRKRFREKWKTVLQQNHFLPGDHAFLARDHGAGEKHALLCDWGLPTPDCDAGSFRICNLMRILKLLGYRVTFFPVNRKPDSLRAKQLQQEGIFVACGANVGSEEQF